MNTPTPPPNVDFDDLAPGLVRRLVDRVFGYDYFICYAWSDGRAYAAALASGLTSRGYECFLDSSRYRLGDNWKRVGAWTLRRTACLIVVGSPGALRSDAVLHEVTTFLRFSSRIVPIDFGGTLDPDRATGPLPEQLPATILRFRESADCVAPSPALYERLAADFRGLRQDKLRLRIFAAASVVLALLAIAAIGFAVESVRQARIAQSQRDEALRKQRTVRARQLAAESALLRDGEHRPQLSLFLGAAGVHVHTDAREPPIASVLDALFRSFGKMRGAGYAAAEMPLRVVVGSGQRRRLIAAGDGGDILVWPADRNDPPPEPVRMVGHGKDVVGLALTRDERWLLSASVDGTTRLWDMDESPPASVAELHDHSRRIVVARFSPREEYILTAGWDDRLVLRPFHEGLIDDPVMSSKLDFVVVDAAISPDEGTLAMAGGDAKTRLWDLRAPGKPAQVRILSSHASSMTRMAFSADGRWLATAGLDRTAYLVDHTNPAAKATALEGHENAIKHVGFLSNGALLTASDDGSVRLWSTDREAPRSDQVLEAGIGQIRAMAISPDERWVACGGESHDAVLWDLADQPPQRYLLSGHDDRVSAFAFSGDSRELFSVSPDQTVRRWPLDRRALDTGAFPPEVPFAHDEIDLMAVAESSRRVMALDHSGTISLTAFDELPPRTVSAPKLPRSVVIGASHLVPERRLAVIGTREGRVQMYQFDDHGARMIADIAAHAEPVTRVRLSPDARWIASYGADKKVNLVDLRAGAAAASVRTLADGIEIPLVMRFGSESHSLDVGSDPDLWHWASLDGPVQRVAGHDDALTEVLETKTWTITSSHDTTIRLWPRRPDGTLDTAGAIVLRGHRQGVVKLGVIALALQPDGTTLASCGVDATVRLWDLRQNGKELFVLEGHDQGTFGHGVKDIAFSRDNRWLASAGEDGSVRLWDLTAPNPAVEVALLPGHTGAVRTLEFTSDGEYLVSGGFDGRLRLWPLRQDEWEREICRLTGRNLTRAEWNRFFLDEPYVRRCPQRWSPAVP